MRGKLLTIIIILVLIGVGLYFMSQQQTAKRPDINYVGHSAEECLRIQVTCIEGFQRFDDDFGCGCEDI